jgi:hypothetical protein
MSNIDRLLPKTTIEPFIFRIVSIPNPASSLIPKIEGLPTRMPRVAQTGVDR